MLNFYKNKIYLLIATFSILVCLFSISAQAQIQDKSKKRDYSPSGIAKEMGIKPIEEYAYSVKDKSSCAKKSAYFIVASLKYKEGVPAAQAAGLRMLQPLMEDAYKNIRDNGMDNALLNNMIEYSNCIDKAEVNSDPEYEYDLALVHKACKKLNDVLIGTVNSIKERKKADGVIRKYSKKPIDFYGTKYEKLANAEILFIGKLYEVSKAGSYTDVVEMASNLSVGCYQ